MKASTVSVQSPSVSKVITRLVFLGVVAIGGVYAFLQICTSVIKIFE